MKASETVGLSSVSLSPYAAIKLQMMTIIAQSLAKMFWIDRSRNLYYDLAQI